MRVSTLALALATSLSLAVPVIPSQETTGPGPVLEWMGGVKGRKVGEVVAGVVLEHTFALFSAGDEDLVLTKMHTSCACTTFTATAVDGAGARREYEAGSPLAPGEVLEIHMRVDTTGKLGNIAYQVKIEANDAKHFHATALRFVAGPAFQAEPELVELGDLWPEQSLEGRFEIGNTWNEPCTVEVLPLRDDAHIDVRLEPVEPDERGWARRWIAHSTLSGTAPPRRKGRYPLLFRCRVAEKADYATADEKGIATFDFKAFLVATKHDMVSCFPRQIQLHDAGDGTGLRRTINLDSLDEDFALALASSDVQLEDGDLLTFRDHVSFEVTERVGGSYDVTMIVADLPSDFADPIQGTIRIRVGHPRQPELVVAFATRDAE